MIWQRPTGSFEAKPLSWGLSAIAVSSNEQLSWRDDLVKKRMFAEALSQHATPFDAAIAVFGSDTAAALWASVHWLADPVVKAAKDVKAVKKILDKDALCNKLLDISEEKSPQGYYLIEPKDRIACIKLYAEIQGYIGKSEVAQFNNFANNNLKVVFVKPDNDHQKIKTIENLPETIENNELIENEEEPEIELENPNNFKPLPKLKIV